MNHTKPITISLCMIVKNEELTLARCLDSVADLVDEIIIVDTGSTDRTVQIARSYTDCVYSFQWTDDFAAARNESFRYATCQYILWLDADDVLLERDRCTFEVLKRQLPPNTDGVIMDIHLASDGNGSPLFASRKVRLVRRKCGYRWHGRIHEDLDVKEGRILQADMAVTHRRMEDHKLRNREILERWIAEEGEAGERKLYFYANECFDQGAYQTAADAFERLLGEASGYREDHINACVRLAECYGKLENTCKQLDTLFRSFRYDVPQSDLCCSIGECFQKQKKWDMAIYWYGQAVEQQIKGFGSRPVPLICYSWLPHVRLSYCYASKGDIPKAHEENGKALNYLPDDPNLLGNQHKLEAALSK